MVEGESGVLAVSPSWNRPLYEPSKRRLTFPNGAIATCYSADEPDLMRGPEHDAAAADELASWKYAEETWTNLMFGLRLGVRPQVCVTTTPRPLRIIRQLMQAPTTVTTRSTTYSNSENLAPSALAEFRARYEGTRTGRQELLAEILDDVPGALWQRDVLDRSRTKAAPDLVRIVVGVDPAVSSHEGSDLTGIVVAGKGVDGEYYLLADRSCRMTPDGWARRAIAAFDQFQADRIIAESNQGGSMVESVLRTVRSSIPVTLVHASRGKVTRAEPIAALFEQNKAHIVGALPELEDEMCSYEPGSSSSPDRMDAAVWALSELSAATGWSGLLEFYRREAEGRGARDAATSAPGAQGPVQTVRMRCPDDGSGMYVLNGVQLTPDAQRFVDVPGERVAHARSIGFVAV
jgi:predicted phage terminase large subunit-like protein